jgi:outer membrane protein
MFNEHWFGNADVRYMKIESDIEVAGVDVGTVDINPWLFGVSIGYRF